MFAPCAGDIGGVPREEMMMGTPPRASAVEGGSPAGSGGRGAAASPAWGASVPFEVSASQQDQSMLLGSSFLSAHMSSPQHYPLQQARAATPREQRNAKSRAKLRQLGARHQLAGGFPGESLADTARPISPRAEELVQEQEDEVDFDDGISAISSHTLEEMERRRLVKDKKNVVRLHHMDFSQIIEEDQELQYDEQQAMGLGLVEEEKNTEIVFGDPFYEEGTAQEEYPTQELAPADLNRVTSTRTHNTTITDESHEFEDMHKRHEAMYWTDQDQVANSESSRRLGRQTTRTTQKMSVEERARRLRELSRSRSRSDGTGSSNKSGTTSSSLVSGQHPHDTMSVYSSDLFPRRKKSSSATGSGWRKSSPRPLNTNHNGFVSRSRTPASAMEDSDPFASLDYGEI